MSIFAQRIPIIVVRAPNPTEARYMKCTLCNGEIVAVAEIGGKYEDATVTHTNATRFCGVCLRAMRQAFTEAVTWATHPLTIEATA